MGFVSLRAACVPFVTPLFVVLMLLSCTKQEESSPDPPPCQPLMTSNWRIAEETTFTGSDTAFYDRTQFVYDSIGRQILRLYSMGGQPDTGEKYTYYSDKVVTITIGFDYIMNQQGLAVSYGTNYRTWNYNEESYLTEESHTYAGGKNTYYYSYSCNNNDRCIRKNEWSPGTFYDTAFCQYYSDKSNTIGNVNHGISFFGKQNNALLRLRRHSSGLTETYTYTFDPQGRVTWQTISDSDGNISYRSFIYK